MIFLWHFRSWSAASPQSQNRINTNLLIISVKITGRTLTSRQHVFRTTNIVVGVETTETVSGQMTREGVKLNKRRKVVAKFFLYKSYTHHTNRESIGISIFFTSFYFPIYLTQNFVLCFFQNLLKDVDIFVKCLILPW